MITRVERFYLGFRFSGKNCMQQGPDVKQPRGTKYTKRLKDPTHTPEKPMKTEHCKCLLSIYNSGLGTSNRDCQ